jgi:hypothetical protein
MPQQGPCGGEGLTNAESTAEMIEGGQGAIFNDAHGLIGEAHGAAQGVGRVAILANVPGSSLCVSRRLTGPRGDPARGGGHVVRNATPEVLMCHRH